MSSTQFLCVVGLSQWWFAQTQHHLFLCRQSVFLSKADSWLAVIFDEEMLQFFQFSWLISHLGLLRASRSAIKPCIVLRLFSWSCAHLRWHCAGFTNAVYWIACCPGEPHLPSFSFQCLRVAGICFQMPWVWTELSRKPKAAWHTNKEIFRELWRWWKAKLFQISSGTYCHEIIAGPHAGWD